ncbi:MAG TPA: hypothetical protein VGK25_08220 [Ignavibacteria bacterium]|jgi:hypothetical protein
MFTVSTPYYLVNIVTKPEVASHLIPNIRNFDFVYFLKEEFKGGKPKETEEKDIVKIQMLCSRGEFGKVMDYVKQYYVKGYGAVCYYEEVNVQV